jgi:hypothetical protein
MGGSRCRTRGGAHRRAPSERASRVPDRGGPQLSFKDLTSQQLCTLCTAQSTQQQQPGRKKEEGCRYVVWYEVRARTLPM